MLQNVFPRTCLSRYRLIARDFPHRFRPQSVRGGKKRRHSGRCPAAPGSHCSELAGVEQEHNTNTSGGLDRPKQARIVLDALEFCRWDGPTFGRGAAQSSRKTPTGSSRVVQDFAVASGRRYFAGSTAGSHGMSAAIVVAASGSRLHVKRSSKSAPSVVGHPSESKAVPRAVDPCDSISAGHSPPHCDCCRRKYTGSWPPHTTAPSAGPPGVGAGEDSRCGLKPTSALGLGSLPALVLFMVASVVILPAGPILRTRGVHSFRLSPGV